MIRHRLFGATVSILLIGIQFIATVTTANVQDATTTPIAASRSAVSKNDNRPRGELPKINTEAPNKLGIVDEGKDQSSGGERGGLKTTCRNEHGSTDSINMSEGESRFGGMGNGNFDFSKLLDFGQQALPQLKQLFEMWKKLVEGGIGGGGGGISPILPRPGAPRPGPAPGPGPGPGPDQDQDPDPDPDPGPGPGPSPAAPPGADPGLPSPSPPDGSDDDSKSSFTHILSEELKSRSSDLDGSEADSIKKTKQKPMSTSKPKPDDSNDDSDDESDNDMDESDDDWF